MCFFEEPKTPPQRPGRGSAVQFAGIVPQMKDFVLVLSVSVYVSQPR